ncbi:MAG TPA: chromate efflux transporter [Lacunisphaera sp.]|jgi:chromate transporter
MFEFKRLSEIAAAFLKLGLISFGGPVAHLSYLRTEFVMRRRWLDDEAYADLVALCQFLPGPASSQTVFGLGMQRAGLPGALIASICFTLPSALLMIAFAYGVGMIGDLQKAAWLHGLRLAAVAVVAQAVWGMGKKLCPDLPRIMIAAAATVFVLLNSTSIGQVEAIAVGALAGWIFYGRQEKSDAPNPAATKAASPHFWAALSLISYAALLIASPAIAAGSASKGIHLFDSFYRAGSLVFGGGHVVLPLLRAEVVPAGWISDDAFLAGYGAVQAVPGPLFTFAAYLGTVIHGGPQAWLGGFGCLLAIFLPAWLLIGGALPFWHLFLRKPWAKDAMRGANAAVVGILLAALCHPLWQETVSSIRDIALVLAAFICLEIWRTPAWLVVVLAAAIGQKFL